MDVNTVREPTAGAQKLPCQLDRQFRKGSPCSVYINHVEDDGLFWVMLESEFHIMEEISNCLNLNDNRQSVHNPAVHDVVSAFNLDNTWYRAIILRTEPNICVRFIDFGDHQVIPIERLASLPPTLSSIQPLAMKLKLSPDSEFVPVVGTSILVDCVAFSNGIPVVDAVLPKQSDSSQSPHKNLDQSQTLLIQNKGKVANLATSPDDCIESMCLEVSMTLDPPPFKSSNSVTESTSYEQTAGEECLLPEVVVPSMALQVLGKDPPPCKSSGSVMESTSYEQTSGEESLLPEAVVPSTALQVLDKGPSSSIYSDSAMESTSNEQTVYKESLLPEVVVPSTALQVLDKDPPSSISSDSVMESTSNDQTVGEEPLTPEAPKPSMALQALGKDPPHYIFSDSFMESTSYEQMAGEESLLPEAVVPSTALQVLEKGPSSSISSDSVVELSSYEQMVDEESLTPVAPMPSIVSQVLDKGPPPYISLGSVMESTNNEQTTVGESLPPEAVVPSSVVQVFGKDPSSHKSLDGVLECTRNDQRSDEDSLLSEAVVPLLALQVSDTCEDDMENEGNLTLNCAVSGDMWSESVHTATSNSPLPALNGVLGDAAATSETVEKLKDALEPGISSSFVCQPSSYNTELLKPPRVAGDIKTASLPNSNQTQEAGSRTSGMLSTKLVPMDEEAAHAKEWSTNSFLEKVSDVANRDGSQSSSTRTTLKNVHSTGTPLKDDILQRGQKSVYPHDSSHEWYRHQSEGYDRSGYLDVGGSGDYAPHQLYPSPRFITKGRHGQNSRPLRGRDISQSNMRSVLPKGNLQTSVPTAPVSLPQDFRTILEFELAIIREQNRIQLLQLQKIMEQNLANEVKILKDEMTTVKEEMTRQLAACHNEVNNRLVITNNSVVHKMADIYSDITMLKNGQEMVRQTHSNMPAPSGASAANCGPSHDYQPSHSSHNIQPHSSSYNRSDGNSDAHRNSQHQFKEFKKDDNHQGNSHNNFPHNPQKQYPNQVVNIYERESNADGTRGPTNCLMASRKEKMSKKDKETPHTYQPASKRERGDNHSDQHSNFAVGQFNMTNYPKMDYFDPSKTGREKDSESNVNKSTTCSIVCVNNLSENVNPDLLLNLFGVYGTVQKVKISQDKGRAFIEMADSAQAYEVVRYLNNAPLMGQHLHVAPCNFEKLILSKQDFLSNSCKDFTKPTLKKFNRFNFVKWDPQKLFAPSQRLMITNVLSSVSDEKIKEVFAKRGFHIQNISTQPCSNDEKKLVFATLGSVEEAVNALTVMHLQELADWMMMRISFAKPDKR